MSVNRASSITEPSSASVSSGRAASTSCSIEVLWWPTRSAPAMRFSMGTRKVMPSLLAMPCASVIMAARELAASADTGKCRPASRGTTR